MQEATLVNIVDGCGVKCEVRQGRLGVMTAAVQVKRNPN